MTATIPLTKGYVAIVDDEDAHWGELKWCAFESKTGVVYALRGELNPATGKRSSVSLHRKVLGVTDPRVIVDHEDGDGLNCRRGNLNPTDTAGNTKNIVGPRRHNTTSPYLGVSFYRAYSKWAAEINSCGTSYFLGYHDTPEEANLARLHKERELWGIQPRRRAAFLAAGLITEPLTEDAK